MPWLLRSLFCYHKNSTKLLPCWNIVFQWDLQLCFWAMVTPFFGFRINYFFIPFELGAVFLHWPQTHWTKESLIDPLYGPHKVMETQHWHGLASHQSTIGHWVWRRCSGHPQSLEFQLSAAPCGWYSLIDCLLIHLFTRRSKYAVSCCEPEFSPLLHSRTLQLCSQSLTPAAPSWTGLVHSLISRGSLFTYSWHLLNSATASLTCVHSENHISAHRYMDIFTVWCVI